MVAWCIVIHIQYMMTHHSHLTVELRHNLMVYLPSHPCIFGCIPVNSHVLYLHFVLLLQATRILSFAYNREFPVVGSIHVCNNQQCKSVFAFCRTGRLVTFITVSSMRKRLLEQSCFITIVDITGGVAFQCRDKYSLSPLLQLVSWCCQLFCTTNSLVHNAVSLHSPMYVWSITLSIVMPNCFAKL